MSLSDFWDDLDAKSRAVLAPKLKKLGWKLAESSGRGKWWATRPGEVERRLFATNADALLKLIQDDCDQWERERRQLMAWLSGERAE